MKTSKPGIDMLIESEGCVLFQHPDTAGNVIIGIGHMLTRNELLLGKVLGDVDYRSGITRTQARSLLRADVKKCEAAISKKVKVELEQHEYDVLVNFIFNIGVAAFYNSQLLVELNKKDRNGKPCGKHNVPAQFRQWNRFGGRVVNWLVKRRNREVLAWKNGM